MTTALVLVIVTSPTLKVAISVTVLAADPLFISETVPVTKVPVVAVLGATEVVTFRSTSTVIVNVSDTVAGLSSGLLAEQVTVVVPTAKVVPEDGAQLTVAAELSWVSSIAAGAT